MKLKSLMPSLTPKQKFVVFLTLVAIIFISYLMMNAFNGSDDSVDVGGVDISRSAGTKTEAISGTKTTTDSEAQRTLTQLEEERRKARLAETSDSSYIDTPALESGIRTESGSNEASNEKKNTVLSIDDLVSEIAAEQEKKQEEKAPQENIVDKLTTEKKIEQQAIEINFNRQSYINGLANIQSELPNYRTVQIPENRPAIAKVTSHQRDLPTPKTKESVPVRTGDGMSFVEETTARREQLISEFLENTGVAGASDNETSNEAVSSSDKNKEYPYREVKSVGDTAYAVNMMPINTDGFPVVQLKIVSAGDMNGAVLSGNFTKMEDAVVLKLSNYSKNGATYAINAIAIDPVSWNSMLADDVDKHYWERYGGVILSSLIQGYSETLQDVSVSDTSAGQRETRERIENFNDRLWVGIGKAGSILAPEFVKNVGRESTVHLYKDRPVGILFLDNFKVPISK